MASSGLAVSHALRMCSSICRQHDSQWFRPLMFSFKLGALQEFNICACSGPLPSWWNSLHWKDSGTGRHPISQSFELRGSLKNSMTFKVSGLHTIFLIWAPLSTWTRLFHFLGNYTEWRIFQCTPETYYSPLLVRCIVHPNLVDSCVLVLTHIQKEHSALTLAVHLLWGLSILVSIKRELIFFFAPSIWLS